CLLPLVIVLQRYERAILSFVDSVSDLNDDGSLDISIEKYAVYLRSFSAEQHYMRHTYTMTVGFEIGVREQMHPGYFVKKSIASLQPELLIVEALNLAEQISAETFEAGAIHFKKVCLFEFKDWPQRIRALCGRAELIFFHLDDTST